MSKKKIQVTNVFRKVQKAEKRIVVNQGGARSSKTYSIAQFLITKLCGTTGKTLSICRKTMPSLKISVMRDFFEILVKMKLYDQTCHNKSDNTYILHGNTIDFLSLDMPQKKRGAKRDYLWVNEANEITYEDFLQLAMRTAKQIFLDYNPSDEFHWIYDRVIPRDDCEFIKSTYLDNPFIDKNIRNELERLRGLDENKWRIYGLGEKGHSIKTIYTNWDIVDALPHNYDDFVWGVDFGYSNPSTLLGIAIKDTEIFVKEFIYESGLTNQNFINKLNIVIPGELRNKLIKADSAEPDRIQEIADAGFNIIPVKKGKNSVKNGIDVLKNAKIHITKDSVHTLKEIKQYSWKIDKDERIVDGEPVKFMDHAMDAMRYACGLDTDGSTYEENVYPDDIGFEIEDVHIGVDEESVLVGI